MGSARLDAFSRALAADHSRRGLMRLLSRVALATPLARYTPPAAEAKRSKGKKKHKRHVLVPTVPPPSPPKCGAGGPCTVFLSSVDYQGNLGGLSGADAKCQALAGAAGLPGSYRAWLSDDTSSPSARFVRSPGPYRLVNGTTIAANWTDLTDGLPPPPAITVTEIGGDFGGTYYVWSNTRANGQPVAREIPQHCVNWTSNIHPGPISDDPNRGEVGGLIELEEWTDAGVQEDCNAYHHLYCFQQS